MSSTTTSSTSSGTTTVPSMGNMQLSISTGTQNTPAGTITITDSSGSPIQVGQTAHITGTIKNKESRWVDFLLKEKEM